MKIVPTQQMREMDRKTIEDHGFPGRVLMENAGRSVAISADEFLPPNGFALVIAGRGNNGGDGFVAARHLTSAGFEVEVALLAQADDLDGDAASNCSYAADFAIPIHEQPDDDTLLELLDRADVIIDAMLGTGISGDVRGRFKDVIEMLLVRYDGPVVAVDIPSGIHADTGQVLGVAVKADITNTFGLAKQGMYQYPGRAHCGEIRVIDISLAPAAVDDEKLRTNLSRRAEIQAMLPGRDPDAHKGDAGRVLIVAASPGLTGAAAMAGMAAARTGSGLVTLAIPASLNPIIESKCTEVMTLPLMDHGCGWLGTRNMDQILDFADNVDAVALGPGMGRQEETAKLVREIVGAVSHPMVIDADGINAFAGHCDVLAEADGDIIITPHPGELSRLTEMSVADIQSDRIGTAQHVAADLGVTVLLKGAGTVTADPGGETWINITGNSGMASGGMGDILTGIIASLLGSGLDAVSAGACGAYLHGLAGDVTARSMGPRGYLATDLLDYLPPLLAELLE